MVNEEIETIEIIETIGYWVEKDSGIEIPVNRPENTQPYTERDNCFGHRYLSQLRCDLSGLCPFGRDVGVLCTVVSYDKRNLRSV